MQRVLALGQRRTQQVVLSGGLPRCSGGALTATSDVTLSHTILLSERLRWAGAQIALAKDNEG
jgi:hypothetical protein